jgi:hypothetical protein
MKKNNPYRFLTEIVNRFRGIWQRAGVFNIDKAYTTDSNNAVSSKIGQLDSRIGQDFDEAYTDGVIAGDRFNTVKYVGEGKNIHVAAIKPVAILGVPDYTPPSEWNPPPTLPPTPDPIDTCAEWWSIEGTPVEDQKTDGVFPDCFVNPNNYTCEDLWDRSNTPNEYRKVGGTFPDCINTLLPPPTGQYTCSELWPYAPALTSYEVAGSADHKIVDGNTDACWAMTCQDMWDQYPVYDEHKVDANADLELKDTGGTGDLADCWDIALNCDSLYSQNPDWDEYRKEGAAFPDCWDFTSDPDKFKPTCAEWWAAYNIPEEHRRDGGYPNCYKLVIPTLPPLGSCKSRLWSFPVTGSDSVTWNLDSGYVTEDTKTLLDFNVNASMYSNEIGVSLKYEIVGRNNTSNAVAQSIFIVDKDQWFYDYINVDPPCRRLITYEVNLRIREGVVLVNGPYEAFINFYVSFGDFKNVLYSVPLTLANALPWEDLYYAVEYRMLAAGKTQIGRTFESFDFDQYSEQFDLISRAQTSIESINGGSAGYIKDNLTFAQIESMESFGFMYTTATLFSDAGISSGFRRRYEGNPLPAGHIQDGDDIGIHLFEDIDACCRKLNKAFRTAGSGTSKPYPYRPYFRTGLMSGHVRYTCFTYSVDFLPEFVSNTVWFQSYNESYSNGDEYGHFALASEEPPDAEWKTTKYWPCVYCTDRGFWNFYNTCPKNFTTNSGTYGYYVRILDEASPTTGVNSKQFSIDPPSTTLDNFSGLIYVIAERSGIRNVL